jgi:hypothetical protein
MCAGLNRIAGAAGNCTMKKAINDRVVLLDVLSPIWKYGEFGKPRATSVIYAALRRKESLIMWPEAIGVRA